MLIIGAGAAGLMCAIEAGKRGRSVCLLDHAERIGEKIRISGGGRCNFTNLHCGPKNFLSENPKFCISALKRYTQQDFIRLVERHRIAYHEKTLGQLFCNEKSQLIIDMLLTECRQAGVAVKTGATVDAIGRDDLFKLKTSVGPMQAENLVIATGGKSVPKIGATGFGYDIARQFGLKLVDPRPGLVPLTFTDEASQLFKALSGVATDVRVACGKQQFDEAMLFTHRGLSGPAILQISSYWREGEAITVDFCPDTDIADALITTKTAHPKQTAQTVLAEHLPHRLAQVLAETVPGRLADQPDKRLRGLGDAINRRRLVPAGSEGWRTAEVTLGGVDTSCLSSQTLEARDVPGLFFIGEVVDVTGHLGGFNFQWAWSSGWAAGQTA